MVPAGIVTSASTCMRARVESIAASGFGALAAFAPREHADVLKTASVNETIARVTFRRAAHDIEFARSLGCAGEALGLRHLR